jgi:hypothetical protein
LAHAERVFCFIPNVISLVLNLILGVSLLNECLKVHPSLKGITNKSKLEDIDFFTEKNYFKGLDW